MQSPLYIRAYPPPVYTVQLNSNLTLGTRKFSKTTCELNASIQMCLKELMTRDAHDSLHHTPNHSNRVLE